jgi:hypothetical protein
VLGLLDPDNFSILELFTLHVFLYVVLLIHIFKFLRRELGYESPRRRRKRPSNNRRAAAP